MSSCVREPTFPEGNAVVSERIDPVCADDHGQEDSGSFGWERQLDNIGICAAEGADWLIKRNLRRESVQEWLKIAQEKGTKAASREGKLSGVGRCTAP